MTRIRARDWEDPHRRMKQSGARKMKGKEVVYCIVCILPLKSLDMDGKIKEALLFSSCEEHNCSTNVTKGKEKFFLIKWQQLHYYLQDRPIGQIGDCRVIQNNGARKL